MQLFRMFSSDTYKGTKDYFKTQKKYELLRTILYFGISLSLFVAGIIATGDRKNLLTVVAILGCLPASKSVVSMIMFFRCNSCPNNISQQIEHHIGDLNGLYDLLFTSYEKNYSINHITVKGNTICGYTGDGSFSEQDFYKHIQGILKAEHFTKVTIKIFKDIHKYTERLEQMKALSAEQETNAEKDNTQAILTCLKSVSL